MQSVMVLVFLTNNCFSTMSGNRLLLPLLASQALRHRLLPMLILLLMVLNKKVILLVLTVEENIIFVLAPYLVMKPRSERIEPSIHTAVEQPLDNSLLLSKRDLIGQHRSQVKLIVLFVPGGKPRPILGMRQPTSGSHLPKPLLLLQRLLVLLLLLLLLIRISIQMHLMKTKQRQPRNCISLGC